MINLKVFVYQRYVLSTQCLNNFVSFFIIDPESVRTVKFGSMLDLYYLYFTIQV